VTWRASQQPPSLFCPQEGRGKVKQAQPGGFGEMTLWKGGNDELLDVQ